MATTSAAAADALPPAKRPLARMLGTAASGAYATLVVGLSDDWRRSAVSITPIIGYAVGKGLDALFDRIAKTPQETSKANKIRAARKSLATIEAGLQEAIEGKHDEEAIQRLRNLQKNAQIEVANAYASAT